MNMECAICLKDCVFPVRLPCKHVFCFLCAKGAINKKYNCPICRAEVPPDYFENPNLLDKPDEINAPTFDKKYSWFYAGDNGWWVYDEENSNEIEECFKQGEKKLDLLIAGHIYTIDLERMIQYRKRDQRRQRKIKRDITFCPQTKGIAGIKIKLNSSFNNQIEED